MKESALLIINTNLVHESDSMVVDTETKGDRVSCRFSQADNELSFDERSSSTIKLGEKAKALDLEPSSKPWQTPHTICKEKCVDKDYRITIKIKNSAKKNLETCNEKSTSN